MIKSSKRKAQSLIEYALILALVAVVAVTILSKLTTKIGNVGTSATNSVGSAATASLQAACTAAIASDPSWSWDATANGGIGECKKN